MDGGSNAGPSRWVEIGTLGRPHGVRGELRLSLHNRDSDVAGRLDRVELIVAGSSRAARVARVRGSAQGLIVTLQGVADRDAAAALTGAQVKVDSAIFTPPDDDELLGYQLEGLRCVDPSGAQVGVVRSIADFGAGTLLAVALLQGGEVLVPFAEPYVGAVDLLAGTVEVDIADLTD
ncbi:MAG: 16S rRNA processing protein RimM [Myxococcales bacterium]|nr:16S rRNA processing protein RimM [Myxococcales bacterium]MCB9531641.1 16S rRNA processing protein RimM [Myxococcales bacterium]MCB9534224.1 16S rRNA processing protein RimM [Myxococcales bacterium]